MAQHANDVYDTRVPGAAFQHLRWERSECRRLRRRENSLSNVPVAGLRTEPLHEEVSREKLTSMRQHSAVPSAMQREGPSVSRQKLR